jgi:hypothetical protein
MAAEWFFQREGQWLGPFSGAQIQELAASGRLRGGDLVRRGAEGKAIPAEQVKGLFKNGAVKERPAPPPPALPHSQAREKGAGSTGKTLTRLGNFRPSKRAMLLSAVAGACLLFCLGGAALVGMFGPKVRDAARKELGQADSGVAGDVGGSFGGDEVVLVDTPLRTMPESVTQNPFQFSADGRFVLANGWAVWNVKTGTKLQSEARFLSSALSPDGKRLAALESGGRNKLLLLELNEDRLALQQRIDLGSNDFYWPSWSPDGKAIVLHCNYYAAPNDRHGVIVALETPPRLTSFSNPGPPDRNPFKVEYPFAIFSPDSKRVTVWYDEPSMCIYEAATGKLLGRKAIERGKPTSGTEAAKEPWELRLVPRDDGRIEVWHTPDNRLAAVVGKSDGVNRCFRAITPDGRFVASARNEGAIEIWDTQQGRKVALKEYKQDVSSGTRPDYLNVKAPPISDATYEQIRVGMTTLEVWKLVGGRPYDDKSTLNKEGRLGTDWITEEIEYYHSKDHPGARIVLFFRGKGTAPPLVKKSLVR